MCAGLAHERLPLGQCGRAAFLVSLAIIEATFLVEVVVEVGVDPLPADFASEHWSKPVPPMPHRLVA